MRVSWQGGAPILLWPLLCVALFAAAQDVNRLIKTADALMLEHQFDRACRLYERALAGGAEFDTDLLHARNIAAAYLNSAPPDMTNGIKWLRVALRLDPQADGLRAQLASLLLRQGDLDGAIEHYRALVAAHPATAEYVLALATALRQAGKSDAALELLQRSSDRFPKLVAVRVEYARLLNFSKQFAEAKRQFQEVLAVDPGNLAAQVGMAKATSFQGDQQTALTMYDHILRQHPGLYDAVIGKAFSLLWSGQPQAARPLLEEGLRRHPGDQEVRLALAALDARNDETRQTPPSQRPPGSTRVQDARPVPSAARSPNSQSSPKAVDAPLPPPLAPAQPALTREGWGRYIVLICGTITGLAYLLYRAFHHRSLNVSHFESPPAQSVSEVTTSPPRAIPVTIAEPDPDFAEAHGDRKASDSPVGQPASIVPAEQTTEAAVLAIAEMPSTTEGLPSEIENTGTQSLVLLVGGSRDLIELETRWLAVQKVHVIAEREWIPAIVHLVNTPPAVIVLNSTTDDGWTTQRILKWLADNLPDLRRHMIVIGESPSLPDNRSESEPHYLSASFGMRHLQDMVQSVLQGREDAAGSTS